MLDIPAQTREQPAKAGSERKRAKPATGPAGGVSAVRSQSPVATGDSALGALLARAVQERAGRDPQPFELVPKRDCACGPADDCSAVADGRGLTDEEELVTNGMFDWIKSKFTRATGGTPTPGPAAAPPPCTATATGVSLGPSRTFKTGRQYGLFTPIAVRGTELADVMDTEIVSASVNHTGSMTERPNARGQVSTYMPADNIPDDKHGAGIATDLGYFDDHGGDGSYDFVQMDLFKIPKCGIGETDMPNSGYRIKREVKAEGTKVVAVVTKTAEAVTVDGHTSTAGLTPQRQGKITLRP